MAWHDMRVKEGTVWRMLFTTHIAVGALAGRLVGRPVPAALLGVASHFALDAVPHWGDTERRVYMRVAVADGLAGLALSVFLARRALRSRSREDVAMLVGGTAAGLPDWDKPFMELTGSELWPGPVNDVHRGIQRESAAALPRELAVGLSAVALCLAVCRRASRGNGRVRTVGAVRRSRTSPSRPASMARSTSATVEGVLGEAATPPASEGGGAR